MSKLHSIFNDGITEAHLSPTEGYPERNVDWFLENILPDFIYDDKDRRKHIGHLLDVGCAFGYFTKEYAKVFDRVTGVDFSIARINQAGTVNFGNNIQYRCVDLTKEIFAFEEYDAAVSSAVFQHIAPDEDRKAAFKAVHAALKPGARLTLYDENDVRQPGSWDGFFEAISPMWIDKHLKGLFALEGVKFICLGNAGEHIYRLDLLKV